MADADKLEAEAHDYIMSFYNDNPFVQYLDIAVTSIQRGKVRLDLKVKHEHTNVYNIAHGGVLMSMADTAMGAACLAMGKKVVTLDCHMNFVHPAAEQAAVYAESQVLHDGAHTLVCTCEIKNEEGTLLAVSGGTFYVIGALDS